MISGTAAANFPGDDLTMRSTPMAAADSAATSIREALALEAGGEGQQVRVVALGQRGDGGGVDAAGEEGTDGDVGAHVLGHGILEGLGDALVHGLLAALGDGADGELGLEEALLLEGAAGGQGGGAAGFEAADAGVQRFGLRDVLQVHVMDEGALVQILVVDAELGGHLEDGLLLRGERGAAVGGGVVQRLDAEGVAGEEQRLLHRVPDGDAEHAAQMLDHVGAQWWKPTTIGHRRPTC